MYNNTKTFIDTGIKCDTRDKNFKYLKFLRKSNEEKFITIKIMKVERVE